MNTEQCDSKAKTNETKKRNKTKTIFFLTTPFIIIKQKVALVL